ncbi:MAG: hypothetical protein PHN26_05810, partial [Eubacteriaceae bacterium]|nr:hypothetical protein [Eubacteriaceae bacterium]
MPGSDVTVKAVFAVKPYSVTVNTSEGGTASATPATAVAGTKITLSATPDKGYTFKEWEVVSGGGYHHGQQLYHAGKRRHGEGRLCGETVQRYRQHQ